MARYSSGSNDLGSAMGGGIALFGLLALVIAAYVLIKCINLVCRVMAAHPSNKLLWLLLSATFGFGLVALVTRGEVIALCLAGVSAAALLLTCRIVELYHATLFEKQGTVVERVLKQPWWEAPQQALVV